MKEVKAGGHTIQFYNGIKEMPMKRFNKMQSFLMQDAGIGSTMADIDQHFKNLDAFLSAGKIDEAIKERQNLHYNMYAALEGISFKSMSFACLIHAIGSHKIGDSDDDLSDALSKLKGVKIGQIIELLDDIKKNCIAN